MHSEGQCMNCDHLFTANEISRYIKDKCYTKSNTYRYCVRSIVGLSLYNLSDSMVESGVVTSLVFCIFIFDNRSQMYYLWDRKSSEDVNVTFTPKR